MVSFQQKMGKAIKKRSVVVHYFSRKSVFIFPACGLILVVLYVLTEKYQIKFPISNIFLLCFGILLITKPIINMVNAYFDIRMKKGGGDCVIGIEFDEENIRTKDKESEENFALKKLFKYHITREFIFLYATKSQYFFIDKRQVEKNKVDYMEEILKGLSL